MRLYWGPRTREVAQVDVSIEPCTTPLLLRQCTPTHDLAGSPLEGGEGDSRQYLDLI